MANELNFYGDVSQTGLTVIARVYDSAGAQVGTDVSCTESGTLAIYVGDMPTATIGQYGVRFFDSGDNLLSQGLIDWDGSQEIQFNIPTILADTNELQVNQGDWLTATSVNLNNNSITSSVIENNAFNNSAFTTGYYNSINNEVDIALADYDAPTKTELDTAEANIIAAMQTDEMTEAELHAALDSYTNKDNWKATDFTAIINAINALNNISVSDIEASTILAKEATLSSIATAIAAIPTTDSVADLTPVLNAIAGLNDVTPAEVRAAFNDADFKDKNTEAEVHAWLDSYTNKNDWKASNVDLSSVITEINANEVKIDSILTSIVNGLTLTTGERDAIAVAVEQAILNEGDGQAVLNAIVGAIGNQNIDEIALVAAIRADLERTGGAIKEIEADTNELQTNQGNFATATGFATPADITAQTTDIKGIEDKDLTEVFNNTPDVDLSTLETKVEADTRQTALIAEINENQVDIANIDIDTTAIVTGVRDAITEDHGEGEYNRMGRSGGGGNNANVITAIKTAKEEIIEKTETVGRVIIGENQKDTEEVKELIEDIPRIEILDLKKRLGDVIKYVKETKQSEIKEIKGSHKVELKVFEDKIKELENVFKEVEGVHKQEIKDKEQLIEELEETAKELIEELEKETQKEKEYNRDIIKEFKKLI